MIVFSIVSFMYHSAIDVSAEPCKSFVSYGSRDNARCSNLFGVYEYDVLKLFMAR